MSETNKKGNEEDGWPAPGTTATTTAWKGWGRGRVAPAKAAAPPTPPTPAPAPVPVAAPAPAPVRSSWAALAAGTKTGSGAPAAAAVSLQKSMAQSLKESRQSQVKAGSQTSGNNNQCPSSGAKVLPISSVTTPSISSRPQAVTVVTPSVVGGGRSRNNTARTSSGQGGQGARGRMGRKGQKDKLIAEQTEFCDIVQSRPKVDDVPQSKKGTQGTPVEFSTNYFPLEKMTDFNLFHYHVEFKPDEERTELRKQLVRVHEGTLGSFIFDGQALYTPHRIGVQSLCSVNSTNQTKTTISLKLVAEISPCNPIFLQVYNIMLRNLMTQMDLELMGRFYYDPKRKTSIPARKLEVWPGYMSSVRNHEDQILLNLEVIHKVVRSDTVLEYINSLKQSAGSHFKSEASKMLLGSIVVTTYNKKNYKVDDIKWDVTPKDTFQMKDGTKMTYFQYYKNQYGAIIKDLNQPMLVSMPKKKDYHRGSNKPIYLVPEICQMTGLSEAMRKDVKLMKDMAQHLTLEPKDRVREARDFFDRMYANKRVTKELDHWNVRIGREPMKCPGRVVELDELVVGSSVNTGGTRKQGHERVKQDKLGDWNMLFNKNSGKSMLTSVPLKNWVLIVPQQSDQAVKQFLLSLKLSAKSMLFPISEPMVTFKMTDPRPRSFAIAIDNIYKQYGGKIQMVMVVLPNNNQEVYGAVKKTCCCDLGIISQCIILKTLLNKNIASITSRLAIQMNAKLGGEPWTVDIPLKDLMVVGYDVFHSPNRKSASVGALVASTSPRFARYFTTTHFHKDKSELSANLCSQMTGALYSYLELNRKLPARIILYRDGVGDGQLNYIYNTELVQIQEAIRAVFEKHNHPPAKFSMIVVTKRIHTRIFRPGMAPNSEKNPPPGTIVDDVITLPERYDFFLITQQVTGNGTVNPTSYNVLYDEQGLDPDKLQRLTVKLCHLYFNYTGTIAVPAPCQFAHKLAYLTGMNLGHATDRKLQNFLYFL